MKRTQSQATNTPTPATSDTGHWPLLLDYWAQREAQGRSQWAWLLRWYGFDDDCVSR